MARSKQTARKSKILNTFNVHEISINTEMSHYKCETTLELKNKIDLAMKGFTNLLNNRIYDEISLMSFHGQEESILENINKKITNKNKIRKKHVQKLESMKKFYLQFFNRLI